MSFQELYKFPEFAPEVLAEYLKAQVETFNRSQGYEAITTHANEEGTQTSNRSSSGFSFGFAARSEAQFESSVKEGFENATGVELIESNLRHRYVPNKVRVHFLAQGKDIQRVARQRYVQLDAGSLDSQVASAPVPQWFTTDLVDHQLQAIIDWQPTQPSSTQMLEKHLRELAQLESELAEIKQQQTELMQVRTTLEQEFQQTPKRTRELSAAASKLDETNQRLAAEINSLYEQLSRQQQAARNQRRR